LVRYAASWRLGSKPTLYRNLMNVCSGPKPRSKLIPAPLSSRILQPSHLHEQTAASGWLRANDGTVPGRSVKVGKQSGEGSLFVFRIAIRLCARSRSDRLACRQTFCGHGEWVVSLSACVRETRSLRGRAWICRPGKSASPRTVARQTIGAASKEGRKPEVKRKPGIPVAAGFGLVAT
jgi:hypothetical protein